MAALGQLAGGIAHDFNNLLTVIIGSADMVAQQLEPDSPARADVEQIYQAASSAASLAKSLLSFSRKRIVVSALDVNETVTQLGKILRRVIGETIQLVVHTTPHDVYVEADRSQIEQVIVNMAVNARDAMPAGGTLTIETGVVDQAGRAFVTVVVSDTGTGMPPDVQARAFEPFFTTKAPGKGTGLGLSTVHEIVRLAHGSISVRSAPNRGTTFTVSLPRIDPPSVIVSVSAASQPTSDGVEPATILLVEDDDGIRSLGARVLRKRGHLVLTARHAEEAIAVADGAANIDLLFTDVVLPGADGKALAQRLRRRHPNLKVLFTSGYGDHSPIVRDLELTGAEYLQKPYASESLAAKIGQVLSPTT